MLETTPYPFYDTGKREEKGRRGKESTKRRRKEGEIKRKHLFGSRPHKNRLRGLQRIAQDPIDYFLISPSELSCQAHISLLSPAFHFMSALAGTLTSSSSYFIMFVSGCAAVVRRSLRPRIREGERETQPGVTQTGRREGEG